MEEDAHAADEGSREDVWAEAAGVLVEWLGGL